MDFLNSHQSINFSILIIFFKKNIFMKELVSYDFILFFLIFTFRERCGWEKTEQCETHEAIILIQ